MRRIDQALGAFLLAASLAPAHAQPVWRCGSSYGHTPCAEGGRAVRGDDARTPEQARQTAAAARRDARAAQQMEAARLARERDAPRAVVLGDSGVRAGDLADAGSTGSKPAAPGKRRHADRRKAADAPFTAVAPKTAPADGRTARDARKPSG